MNVALRDGRPDRSALERAIRIVGAGQFAGRILRAAGTESREAEVGRSGAPSSRPASASSSPSRGPWPPIPRSSSWTRRPPASTRETEQRIRDALRVLLQGRTSLVIAHRLSTIRYVDRILVLHRGVLVEEGTHDELIRRGGIYARYYELEYRGQEAEPRVLDPDLQTRR